MQLIYQGKTNHCHPIGTEFPEGFNITHTKNHWSNENKVIEHLESIIFLLATSKRGELDLEEEQKYVLIFYVFKAQCTQRVFYWIDENHCVTVFVPANFIHVFQPLDLAINSVAKSVSLVSGTQRKLRKLLTRGRVFMKSKSIPRRP